MTEAIYSFFAGIFQDNIILATILISMVPIIEIKGAIPFSTSSIIWKELAMTNWESFGWAILGSSIIVPIITLLFKPIIDQFKKIKALQKIGCAIEDFVLSKSERIENNVGASKNQYWKKLLLLFIFVALPLPLTGVWTGTCIAICMNVDYFSACITVILGNIIAGTIITLILEFLPWLNDWLFFIFLGIIILFLIIKLLIYLINKKKNTT